MSKPNESPASTAVTKESKLGEKLRTLALDALHTIERSADSVALLRGRNGSGKPTGSPKKSTGRSTSTKVVTATYAAELTVDESDSLWITVTPLGSSEVYSARLATGTYSDIYGTLQRLLNVLPNTSNSHLLYRC